MSGFSNPNIRTIPLEPTAISVDFTQLTRAQRAHLDEKDLGDFMRSSMEQPFEYVYDKISHNNKGSTDIT